MAGGRKEYEMLFKMNAALGSSFKGGFKTAVSTTKELQKSINGLNSTARKVDGFQNQTAALQRNKERLAALSEEHARLKEKIDLTGVPTKKLSKEFKNNEKNIKDVTEAIKLNETAIRSLDGELRQAGIDTGNLEAENLKLARAYETVRHAQQEYGKYSTLYAQNRAAVSAARTDLLKTVGVAAAVGTAIYLGPVQSAKQFQSNMADVVKVVDGLRDESTGKLTKDYHVMKNELLELSTVIPMIPKEITEIAAAAGQANIAREEIVGFTTDAAKMGIAFDTTAEQAGDWMAKWRSSFKMTQPAVVELSDKINYLGNTSAAKANQIAGIVTKVGPLGEVAGFATGEIAALGATLVGVGVQEDVAATGIKKLMTTMTAGDAATKRQVGTLNKLNLSAKDLAARMQVDAKGAVIDFMDALKKLPEAEQAAALKNYFGEEAVAAIAPMLTSLDTLETNFRKVGDASQYAGSMQKEYAARADTDENQDELLKNKVTVAMINAGEALLPVAREVTAYIADMVTQFSTWAKQNPETIKNLVLLTGKLIALRAGFQVVKLGTLEVRGAYLLTRKVIAKFGAESAAAGASAVSGMSGAAGAATGLKGALGLIASPAGLAVAGVAALTVGVAAYIAMKKKAREEIIHFSRDLQKAAENFDTINSKVSETKVLTDEYGKLREKVKGLSGSSSEAAAAKERMLEIEDMLIEQNPLVLSKYDKENGKIAENIEWLEKKNQKELEISQLQLEQAQREAEDKLPAAMKEYADLQDKRNGLLSKLGNNKDKTQAFKEFALDYEKFLAEGHTYDEELDKIQEITSAANAYAKSVGETWTFTPDQEGMDSVQRTYDFLKNQTSETSDSIKTVDEELAGLTQSAQDFYNTGVKLAEIELGGNFSEKLNELDQLKQAYGQFEKEGKTNNPYAIELKGQIDELQPKVLNAAAEIRDVGKAVEGIPDVITLDAESAVSGVAGLKKELEELQNTQYTATVNLITTQSGKTPPVASSPAANTPTNGTKVHSNAKGNIVTRPILTTFAEDGPEAAIPLNNSARSRSLWVTTGKAIGMIGGENAAVPDAALPVMGSSAGNTFQISNAANINLQASSENEIIQMLLPMLEQNNQSILQQVLEALRGQHEDKARLEYA